MLDVHRLPAEETRHRPRAHRVIGNLAVRKCLDQPLDFRAGQRLPLALLSISARKVDYTDQARTAPERNNCRSLVSTGTCRARAVAARMRSAGSSDNVGGCASNTSASAGMT